MPWDSSLPDGDISIALGDDAIRANNVALEAALDLEHVFATGGDQHGRHKFTLDTPANIAALGSLVAGAIAFDNSTRNPAMVMRVYDGTTWQYVHSRDPSNPVAYIFETQEWTRPQNMQWQDVTPGAGSPNTVAIDMALQPFKAVTITADTEIQLPTNQPSTGFTQTVMLQVTNSGAGHTISWATGADNYVAPNGVTPIYDNSDGAINIFQITRLRNGDDFLVTSAISVGTF